MFKNIKKDIMCCIISHVMINIIILQGLMKILTPDWNISRLKYVFSGYQGIVIVVVNITFLCVEIISYFSLQRKRNIYQKELGRFSVDEIEFNVNAEVIRKIQIKHNTYYIRYLTIEFNINDKAFKEKILIDITKKDDKQKNYLKPIYIDNSLIDFDIYLNSYTVWPGNEDADIKKKSKSINSKNGEER